MKLRDYYCEEIELETSIRYSKPTWDKILELFSREKTPKARPKNPTGFRSFFRSSDREVDYHYHVSVDNSSRNKKKAINFSVSLHPDSSSLKKTRKPGAQTIDELGSWLLGLMEPAYSRRALEFRWQAEFVFDRTSFAPVFPMPFKSPMGIPDDGKTIGDLSISGLKFKVEGAGSGLRTIYFETFKKVITVTTIFRATTVLKSGAVEQFLNTAAPVAALFVRKEPRQ